MTDVVLHQFLFSHFNDKARWALSYKGIQHRRVSYLPGPHLPALKKLSGQPQTPVLQYGREVIAGSARIIDFLESRHPDPRLYPTDPAVREAVLRRQAQFDDEVGPAVRTALFAVLIDEPDYLCAMFGVGKGALKRLAYRASFPFARRLIAKGNGVDSAANIAAALERTERAVSDIEAMTAASGYIVGDRFTVADLTAAALLAPLYDPEVADMSRPHPRPPALKAFLARWAGSPTSAWVEGMYRQHRTG